MKKVDRKQLTRERARLDENRCEFAYEYRLVQHRCLYDRNHKTEAHLIELRDGRRFKIIPEEAPDEETQAAVDFATKL